MGNKSGRKRQYFLFYCTVSCIIAGLTIIDCAPVQDNRTASRSHQQLEQYRESMAAGFFKTIIEQSEEILAENETVPPADVALYSLGEVYAHHDYEGRDYVKSQFYFEKLIENFPDTTLASEAKTYISLFETIAAQEEEAAAVEEKLLHKDTQAAAEISQLPQKEIIVVKEKKSESVRAPRRVVENQNFAEAAQRNLQIIEELGPKKPADEAFYNLGLIYAHVDNPTKDYKKSKLYFHILTTQFPDSDFAEEAKIWLGLFETIEKMQQIDDEIEEQKKQLNR